MLGSFTCPHCNQGVEVNVEDEAHTCPACGNEFSLPKEKAPKKAKKDFSWENVLKPFLAFFGFLFVAVFILIALDLLVAWWRGL